MSFGFVQSRRSNQSSHGVIRFSADSFGAIESDGVAILQVNRIAGSDGSVSVSYATSDSTAHADVDYEQKSGFLTWMAGDSEPKYIVVDLIDDPQSEPSRSFNVQLSNATDGAALGSPNSAVTTILDDDVAGTIAFSNSSFSVGITDESVTLDLVRTIGSDGVVSVGYTLIEGTAKSAIDYVASDGGTAEFANGVTAKQIEVALIPADIDADILADEPWAYWKFDETAGAAAADSSGNARSLPIAVGAVNWGQGTLNASSELSAGFSGSAMAQRDATDLIGEVDIAVEAWVYPAATVILDRAVFMVAYQFVDTPDTTENHQFMCYITTDGHPKIVWEYGAGINVEMLFDTLTVPSNLPAYIVYGRDVTAKVAFCRLNDGEVVEIPYTIAPEGGSKCTITVGNSIGTIGSPQQNPLTGLLSQMAVYTEPLRLDRYARWRVDAVRTFSAQLSGPMGGATIGAQSSTEISIESAA